ncbi:sodium/proton antiporter (CPA1 family) [Paenibacillus cellulosilyticus]|uniref:Sodium/proton antiporter (CPA1 family) n=1 Tax=Paenibacillus cellulosilyticus TaxID=375489 RepID=A0A2V2YUH5_9BACL|nr:Na+/H+ antiporter [Paenibacillus cellulosilyticus]PWW02917.1 sodium/proton antiporter (CPA1 family) [Paenibacillus cellulosilyticus]QKS45825.1 Na+/H+ antiporter [Paenibacillus cellulosilyticus]
MELFLLILGLLALIAVSNVLNRIVPSVPVPLFQIALGAVLVLLPTGIELELEPELFFVLFIAPLLFNDGKRTPREELWKLRGWILLLAVGLVFVTVVAVGYGIHWLLPSIPLSAAFALAAILSPTDAVAVGALSGRINLPKGILRLLEGEALMNDASGLVAFKFAVAATVTGAFSLAAASWSFIVIALGGVWVGIVLSLVFIAIRSFLRRLGIEDATMHVLIQILTPFVIYMLAEEVGVSGILGVVAGGIFHAVAKDRLEPYATKLQVVSTSTWSVILFILNGLVFILLGLQIPHVTEVIWEDPHFNNAQAIGYVLIITLALYVLRFVWVYLFSVLEGVSSSTRERLHSTLLTTLSGVRGAVTLAGAFSIPLLLDDGSPFPERDLIIFLSAGVILVTLIVASVVLPLLSRKTDGEGAESKHLTEHQAQVRILEMAVRSLKDEITDDNREVIAAVLGDYGQKLRQVHSEQGFAQGRAMRAEVCDRWLFAIQAERKEAARLVDNGELAADTAKRFESILSRTESILANRSFAVFYSLRLAFKQIWKKISSGRDARWSLADIEAIRELRMRTSKVAINELQINMRETDNRACTAVIQHYQEGIRRTNLFLNSALHNDEEFQREKKEWERKAIQMERDALQEMYVNGEVTIGMVNHLRFFINTMEASLSEEEME